MEQPKDKYKSILRLWSAWIYSTGALILLVLISLWVKPLYMPFVAFAFELALFSSVRHNRKTLAPGCYLVPYLVTRILFWAAIIMLVINGLHARWLEEHLFDPVTSNPDLPYVTILVLGPVATLISGLTMLHPSELTFCRDCKLRHGTPAERGFIGILFTQEGQYQNSFLTAISAAITAVTWGYYFVAYDNSEFTRHDKFFYVIIPVVLWSLGALYLAIRYVGIWAYYRQRADEHHMQNGRTTTIRYIVIWDNFVALLEPSTDPDAEISVRTTFDTPIQLQIRYRSKLTIDDALHYFRALSHIEHPNLRFLYSTLEGNPEGNIYHYLAFLTDEQKAEFEKFYPKVKWYSLSEIGELINTRRMAPLFSAAFIRLHTIAMAWKTYTIDGRRRYKVRHYVPTFRIRDIHKWDLDYNDKTWLYVAKNNQDVPFFRWRKFWRKYVSGATD